MDKEHLNARHQLVAKRNDLVQNARQPLTKLQNEVIQYMVSKIKPTDKPGSEYKFKCSEFYALLGYTTTSYTDIKSMLSSIGGVNWWVEGDKKGKETMLMWFQHVELDKNSDVVSIRFNPDIEPYLFQLVEQKALFSSYPFQYIALMKSFYSQKLYEQLNTHKHDKPKQGRKYSEWIYEIGTGSRHDLFPRIAQAAPKMEFRVRFDRKEKKTKVISKYEGYAPGEPMIPESWKNFAIFKRDVLEPAVKEINRYTDILVRYEPLKTDLAGRKSRRYVAIRFLLLLKSEGQIQDTENYIDSEYQEIEDARTNHQYTLDEVFGDAAQPSVYEEMDKLREEQERYEEERRIEKERRKAEEEENELQRRAEMSPYPAATESFGKEFTDDQLVFLFRASFRNLPPGWVKGDDRELWLTDYMAYYKSKVDATHEDTKTTPYKRLLDMLKKDYDGVGRKYAYQYAADDPPSGGDSDDADASDKARKYIERIEDMRSGENQ